MSIVKQSFSGTGVVPAYYRLQQELLGKITDGTWKPGGQIPPERELAASSGLSIGTVKKAILNLVQAGYCYRVQGKGTFISKTSIDQDFIKYYRMRNTFQDADAVMSVGRAEVRECPAPPVAAAALGLETGTPCLAVTRIFLNEKNPVIYTVSYVLKKYCAALLHIDASELTSISLYVLLERYCDMPTIHCDEILAVENAPRAIAAVLNVQENTPLLRVSMVAQMPSTAPCEYRESYIKTTELGLCREHVFRR